MAVPVAVPAEDLGKPKIADNGLIALLFTKTNDVKEENLMKLKSGNVIFGAFTVIFGLIFLMLAIVAKSSLILSGVFLAIFITLTLVGGIEVVRYALDSKTLSCGKESFATVTKKENAEKGAKIIQVDYEYLSEKGAKICYVAKVPESIAAFINLGCDIPVKLRNSRAVIDVKRLKEQSENKNELKGDKVNEEN